MLWIGRDIHQTAPPIPERVVSESGQVLYTRADIDTGRQVWQSIGGHQNGSIWGHGALLAPDWSADWLHREAMAMLDMRADAQFGVAFDELDVAEQARLQAQAKPLPRTNTYDPATGTITVRSEEHTSELQSLMRTSYAVFCLKKKRHTI